MRLKGKNSARHPNWWVITGGPHSGKSQLLDQLALLGEVTIPEAARVYISNELSHGKTIEQIRANELDFQRKIFELKGKTETKIEKLFGPRKRIWWERGNYEDSIAYLISQGLEEGDFLKSAGETLLINNGQPMYKYKGVFILDQIPYQKDYARTEDGKKAKLIHKLIEIIYVMSGYQPIKVPVMPVEERAYFVLNYANQHLSHSKSIGQRFSTAN